jgi:pyruvate/2-oxoglutarate/acetoin dehydrogenase E1 component
MKYIEVLTNVMSEISQFDNTIFLGQAVEYPGTGMFQTLSNVPNEKKMELPVEEDFQLGMSIGLSIMGKIPISIFPRWNFLLLATNQLVNHLDKLNELFAENSPPKVVIRTAIGSVQPLHPGPQHVGDFSDIFRKLLPSMNVVRLDDKNMIRDEYLRAVSRSDGKSTILVEWSDKYYE